MTRSYAVEWHITAPPDVVIEARTGFGDVDVGRFNRGVTIETAFGEIEAEAAGPIDLASAFGDIELVLGADNPDDVKVATEFGDVDVRLPMDRAGRVLADTDFGSVDAHFGAVPIRLLRARVLADGASEAPYPDVEPDPETPAPQRVELYQQPRVEGALLSLDTASGDVIAMVGGRDYQQSEFNRATQASRQPGSSFKPFIYGAALSRGYTPVSTIWDRPLVINDPELGSWKPRNYGRRFYGPMPMRRALAKSVNNATVHLFRDVGVDYVIDYARRLGIQSPLSRDLTLALGSSDVSLLELTSSYAVFPNGGRRVVPRFITKVTNRDGEIILEDVPLGTPPAPVLRGVCQARSI